MSMLFNSPHFLFIFVPLTVLATWVALRFVNRNAAVAVLIGASLIFYIIWKVWAVFLLLMSCGANLGVGYALLRVKRKRLRRSILWAAIIGNLGMLAYFKYANFFLENLRWLGWDMGVLSVILPLGISFFTFQKIAFVFDVYRGQIKEIRPLEFLLMVVFFPQLIAGPIVHYKDFVPQVVSSLRIDWNTLSLGLSVFAFGLCKKVFLADTLALYATPRFAEASNGPIEFFAAWIGALSYSFQLYFDFSGYSDMAIGLALMFGIMLPLNFLSPYKSTSIIDFWRRWHITLSNFLRDYVYFPLGGNRHGEFNRYRNLFTVMLVGGLWHGAAWTFVIWGGIHGLLLVVNHQWRSLGFRMPAVIGGVLTFAAVVFAWVYFRASSLTVAGNMISGMLGMNGAKVPYAFTHWIGAVDLATYFHIGESLMHPVDFFAALVWLFMAAGIVFLTPNTMQIFGLTTGAAPNRPAAVQFFRSPIFAGIFLFLGIQGALGALPTEFLYFQF